MSAFDQENFKARFTELMQLYVKEGLPKNEAAARALKEAHASASMKAKESGDEMDVTEKEETTAGEKEAPNSGDTEDKNEKSEKDEKEKEVVPDPVIQIEPELSPELLQATLAQCAAEDSYGPLIRIVSNFFRSIESIMEAFQLPNDSKMDEASEEGGDTTESLSIDLDKLTIMYDLLLNSGNPKMEGVANSVGYALQSLCEVIKTPSRALMRNVDFGDAKQLRVFIFVLEYPKFSEVMRQLVGEDAAPVDPYGNHQQVVQILKDVLLALAKIPVSGKQLLVQWLTNHASLDRVRTYIDLVKKCIEYRLQQHAHSEAILMMRVLALLHIATLNEPSMDPATGVFYIPELNNSVMIVGERAMIDQYRDWKVNDLPRMKDLQEGGKEYRSLYLEHDWSSFVSYAFVLSPRTKKEVLRLEARIQQKQEEEQEIRQAQMMGETRIPTARFYFILSVRREHLIADTLPISFRDEKEFRKELKVLFDGEDGIDAGGVRKEYYMLMMKQLLDPGYAMFKYFEESRMIWFHPDGLVDEPEYEMIGLLTGIAIYNDIVVDLPMPSALFKKLKNENVTLKDLALLQPALANGLQQLLDFDGDVEGVFQFTFEITYSTFGENKTIPLIEGGSDVAVNNSNRQQYVDMYVDYILNTAIDRPFQAFKRGFYKVCAGESLDLFSSTELELLICGDTNLDFHELERGSTYEGFNEDDETTALFWRVLHEFDETDKKCFLKFLTGSDRCPIGGLSYIQMVVQKNTDEQDRLISAHTCFNTILLPAYRTYETMKEKIVYSMTQTEGFGLH
jgi:hypothetical protein